MTLIDRELTQVGLTYSGEPFQSGLDIRDRQPGIESMRGISLEIQETSSRKSPLMTLKTEGAITARAGESH